MDDPRPAAIAEATPQGTVQIGRHTHAELRNEGFTVADVIAALTSPAAEVTEDYRGDPRAASCLILASASGRPIHLVVTTPPRPLFIITVYDPSRRAERRSVHFRRRVR